jgi:hypothetical protein
MISSKDLMLGGNYLTALENASPKIEAIAITDYYLTHSYEKVLEAKKRSIEWRRVNFPEH